MAVALRCETGRGRPYVARLRDDARRLMALMGLAACELSIVIADDAFVHGLNLEFRGKDRPTDVLSFSQIEEASEVPIAVAELDGACAEDVGPGRRRAALPRGVVPDLRAGGQRRGATLAPLPSGRLPPGAPAGTLVPPAGTALGDVVISVDTALRQARRLGVAPGARLRTLLVHGLLHLLGYDHERSSAEARRMFARERELAAALRRVPRAATARGTKPAAPARAARPARGNSKPRGA